ncbi:hypothetical protein [Methylibium sp.]|uniref:hypothetical protein n=1 Tax=Methylibium sp. TaxID=2067992 RepID=UPI003D130931
MLHGVEAGHAFDVEDFLDLVADRQSVLELQPHARAERHAALATMFDQALTARMRRGGGTPARASGRRR